MRGYQGTRAYLAGRGTGRLGGSNSPQLHPLSAPPGEGLGTEGRQAAFIPLMAGMPRPERPERPGG